MTCTNFHGQESPCFLIVDQLRQSGKGEDESWKIKNQLTRFSLRWWLTVFESGRCFWQTFLVLLVDEHEGKLGEKVIYEALDADNYLHLARSPAMRVRPPLPPGKFVELTCTTLIGDAKARIHIRELRTALRHGVLSESVLGAKRGYRRVETVISMGR